MEALLAMCCSGREACVMCSVRMSLHAVKVRMRSLASALRGGAVWRLAVFYCGFSADARHDFEGRSSGRRTRSWPRHRLSKVEKNSLENGAPGALLRCRLTRWGSGVYIYANEGWQSGRSGWELREACWFS